MQRWFRFALLILIPHAGVPQDLRFTPITTTTDVSFRGLSVIDDRVAWVSGNKGTVGRTTDGGKSWDFRQVPGFEKLDFRSLYGFDAQHAVIANAGSPAFVLRTEDGGATWTTVFTSTHKDVFFDGTDFWNANNGLIYGDPIDGKLFMIRTSDGGKTWISLLTTPALEKGEASFAASGTGIRCTGRESVVICTGGMVSRLWMSDDGGATWTDYRPPVVQGKPSAGIFSISVHNNSMTIVGGDFQDEASMKILHLYSTDRGQQWHTPASTVRGYRECVEQVSSSVFIAVGPSGADYSTDGGASWKLLSDQKGLHVIRKARKGNMVLAAGGSGQLFLLKGLNDE